MASTCKDFKPHQLRPERCRNCFQDKSKHSQLALQQQAQATSNQQANTSNSQGSSYSSLVEPNQYNHRNLSSSQDRAHSINRRLPNEEVASSAASTPSTGTDRGNRIQILATKPIESTDNSSSSTDTHSADVRYVLQVRKSHDSNQIDRSSIKPSASITNDHHRLQTINSLDPKDELQALRKRLSECEMDRKKKDKENQELQTELKRQQQVIRLTEQDTSAKRTAQELLSLQKRNRELEHINEDYRDEIKCLKLEMKELSEECQNKVMKISAARTADDSRRGSGTSGHQQQSADSLREENEKLKDEIKMLEQELDEIQDTFKEEESEQFESLKQDLDLASKNCRILQFKLKKSERQYAQLEQVKVSLERQLQDMCLPRPDEPSLLSNDINRQYSNNNTINRSMDGPTITLPSTEYDQLIRDLHDTMEHEKDLQEQIKYCQEESRVNADKLSVLESENEILTNKVAKLVETKSNAIALAGRQKSNEKFKDSNNSTNDDDFTSCNVSELLQQIEQLKLSLEISQNEKSTLKLQCNQLKQQSEQSETKIAALQKKLDDIIQESSNTSSTQDSDPNSQRLRLLQVECRQLRTKLLESDRENRQLRTRVELSQNQQSNLSHDNSNPDSQLMLNRSAVFNRSKSLEQSQIQKPSLNAPLESQISKYRAELSMIKTQNDMLIRQNEELQERLRGYVKESQSKSAGDSVVKQESDLESDYLIQLKNRLQSSEQELAVTKSRLVELELENTRNQREYKRLKQSLEYKRPPLRSSQIRETSTRQELRDIIKSLEDDLSQAQSIVMGKESMLEDLQAEIRQLKETCEKLKQDRDNIAQDLDESIVSLRKLSKRDQHDDHNKDSNSSQKGQDGDVKLLKEQNETFKLQLEQERLCISNLREDIRKLEASRKEVATQNRMLERERVSMEEEVDKFRMVNKQLLEKTDELSSLHRSTNNRVNELTTTNQRLKSELSILQSKISNMESRGGQKEPTGTDTEEKYQRLERNCDELKSKNLFLLKKLDGMEFEFKNKMEEFRTQYESQKKRELELARLEVRETSQAELQNLRDELNETRQKLSNVIRHQGQADHEYKILDEKYKNLDKEFKREKSRLTTRIEQLEQDLDIEQRKRDHLERDKDSKLKDKNRQLLNVQDTCVQLERDLKRAQTKLNTTENDFELRMANLVRELSKEKKEKDELTEKCRKAEEEYYYQKMRFDSEKSALSEAMDSARKSYDEKIAEIKSLRELMAVRQDQHFKEKLLLQEKVQSMENATSKMSALEYDLKQMKNKCETQETNLDQLRRDERLFKEEKTRLRAKCDELERKCSYYEKKELASKTSTISPTGTGNQVRFGAVKIRSSDSSGAEYETRLEQLYGELGSTKSQLNRLLEDKRQNSNDNHSEYLISEKLTGKINDQRHQIKMLKAQIDDLMAEMKNSKLLHRAEKGSWQVQMAEMTSKLNETEEKLLMETSSRLATRNLAKTRMEIAWQKERQSSQDLIRHQHNEIKTLTEDLRKVSDTLKSARASSERNEKVLASLSQANRYVNDGAKEKFVHLTRQIDICEYEKCKLESKFTRMVQYNEKVTSTMLKELEPLLPIITKIINSLDKADSKDNDSTTTVPTSSISDYHPSQQKQSSTNRPLTTSSVNTNLPDDGDDEASLASGLVLAHNQPPSNTSNRPLSITGGTSRLSRLLSKKPAAATTVIISSLDMGNQGDSALGNLSGSENAKPKGKATKKVKIKSSAIGISTSEKKQMKLCLKKLEKSIEEIKSLPAVSIKDYQNRHRQQQLHPTIDYSRNLAKRSSLVETNGEATRQRQQHLAPSARGVSYTPTRTFADTNRNLTKDWHSDMESQGSSPTSSALNVDDTMNKNDHYRRFLISAPYGRQQTIASSNYNNLNRRSGADSATDYDSESSIASDFNGRGALFRVSGTESDSGIRNSSSGSNGQKSGHKKRNLKSRFTNTLRNISRSITGLTSDNEDDDNTNIDTRSRSGGRPTERPKQINTLV